MGSTGTASPSGPRWGLRLARGRLTSPLLTSGGAARARQDLATVPSAQHYRLADWHNRADRNYRRFFDIDGLVGVRVEQPEVFARPHRLVAALAAAGRISAVRVDHVDGLLEPRAYLRRLAAATGLPIVVEKILTGDERLHTGWPVAGTTGYEVIDDIGGALVAPDGHAALVGAGRAEGDPAVAEATLDARRLVVATSFTGEVHRLAGALDVAAAALADTLVRLPVSRTYLPALGPDPSGRARLDVTAEDLAALAAARGTPERDAVVAALVDPARRPAALATQQLMGAVMAKGVEDTAWYRLSGPLAFFEVGGDPGRDRRDGVGRLPPQEADQGTGDGCIPGAERVHWTNSLGLRLGNTTRPQ